MDRITYYLEAVGATNLLFAAFAALVVLIFMLLLPRRMVFSACVAALPPWMVMGLLNDIGFVADFAKVSSVAITSTVAFLAWRSPVRYTTKTPAALLYLTFGVVSLAVAILGPPPVLLEVVLKFQWLVIAVSALLVVRTLEPGESLERLLHPLILGFGIAVVILAVPAMTGAGMRAGIQRYFPWGANPNQVGPYMSVAVVFGLLGMQRARVTWKPVAGAVAIVALGLIFLTKSRSTLALAVLGGAPAFLSMARRPLIAIAGGAVAVACLGYYASTKFSDQSYDRLLVLDSSSRDEIALAYLQRIQMSPVFGNMFGMGEGSGVGGGLTHTHNIYLEVLVEGGVVKFLPFITLVAVSAIGAVKLARSPDRYGVDPLLGRTLACLLCVLYLHGFVNNNSFYGTSAVAWVVVFCGAFCMRSLGSSKPAYGRLA